MTQYFGYPSHDDFQSHRDSLDAEEWFLEEKDREGAATSAAQHNCEDGCPSCNPPQWLRQPEEERTPSIAEFCWPFIDDVEWDVRLAYNRDTNRYEQLRSEATPENTQTVTTE